MLRSVLSAIALLTLAGCNALPGATPVPTLQATPGAFTVSISSALYFVGPTGRALYTFDADTLGRSTCEGDCLANWPALEVASTPEITVGPGLDLAEFTAISRDDGANQVTYKLIPLYYFAGDPGSGTTNGDGVGGVWHLAKPGSTLPTAAPATPTPAPTGTPAAVTPGATPDPNATCDPAYDDCDKYTPKPTAAVTPGATAAATVAPSPEASPGELMVLLSEDGMYLTDEAGMALYTFDNDTEELVSTCVDTCAENWPPLLVPAGATIVPGEGVEGDLVSFARPDGSMQVAWGTTPLYLYAGDQEPGDTNGDGVNDVWHLTIALPVINPL